MVLGKAYPALLGNLAGGGFSTRILKPVFSLSLEESIKQDMAGQCFFVRWGGDLVFKSFKTV